MQSSDIQTENKYLITTDNWFIAPNGCEYRAVFGTVHRIESSEETLGLKPMPKVQIGM